MCSLSLKHEMVIWYVSKSHMEQGFQQTNEHMTSKRWMHTNFKTTIQKQRQNCPRVKGRPLAIIVTILWYLR